MKTTEPKTKNSSKIIPIISFLLFIAIGPFNSGAGGFFLFVSVASFLFCRMTDNPPAPSSASYSGLSDWNQPEESEMFAQKDLFERNCPTSIDLAGEVEICPRGINEF